MILHVLNLGAGINSTHLYLLAYDDRLQIDAAIFADTQEEPAAVYQHLEWLQTLGGPPILTGTAGKLGDDLLRGVNSRGGRFASIPAYTRAVEGGPIGRTRRQCTKDYKINVVKQIIRRRLLGMQPRQRVPKGTTVVQYFGFSFEEQGRACRTLARFAREPWSEASFPLIDREIRRRDSIEALQRRVPHPVGRSACVFCPFKSQREWRCLRAGDPNGWQRARQVDEGLRRPGAICNRKLDQKLYVHRSCQPLHEADLGDAQLQLFDEFREDCEGGCGT